MVNVGRYMQSSHGSEIIYLLISPEDNRLGVRSNEGRPWNEIGSPETRCHRGDVENVHRQTGKGDPIKTGWWFQIFFIFIPTWGNDPF